MTPPGARAVPALPGCDVLPVGWGAWAAWSDASRGDLRPSGHGPGDGPGLVTLAGDLVAAVGAAGPVPTVAWVSQVHGAEVVVTGPGAGRPGACRHLGVGDAVVAVDASAAAAVLTADCGPVALASPEGLVAAVHAGWRGVLAGVVEAAADRLRSLGASRVAGVLGPCIHAGACAFGEDDLVRMVRRYGESVQGETVDGSSALDLPAAVAAAFQAGGIEEVGRVDRCTASSSAFFSHRARADTGRQALVVWWSGGDGTAPS